MNGGAFHSTGVRLDHCVLTPCTDFSVSVLPRPEYFRPDQPGSDFTQRDDGRFVAFIIDMRRRTPGKLAGAVRSRQGHPETVGNALDAIIDSNSGHKKTL